MKLGLCLQALYHLPFEDALRLAAAMGFEAVELPVDRKAAFVDLDAALAGGWRQMRDEIEAAGLRISAISNHQESQLLLGPHGEDTDLIFRGSARDKIDYATDRLRRTADLARVLDVAVVCGFTGCEDYSRWFPWPLADGYERMAPTFRERLLPILDYFEARGVHFAHECHPRQFAYNLETALWSVELLNGHPAWRFNLDPANLVLAGVDPVVFVAELGDRIAHVHAKDCERVEHNIGRSGLLAHGAWSRPDRGFRFRVPGWGEIPWKRLISELQIRAYGGVLAVEHEDPTMDPIEGLEQASAFLEPLVLRRPRPEAFWW